MAIYWLGNINEFNNNIRRNFGHFFYFLFFKQWTSKMADVAMNIYSSLNSGKDWTASLQIF